MPQDQIATSTATEIEVAQQNQEAATSEEPTVDAPIIPAATPSTSSVPEAPIEKPIVNFEHRFDHFKNELEENLHAITEAFKVDIQKLIAEFKAKVKNQ